MDNFSGWLNVYKPFNISSFGVVSKIRNKFSFLKVGHAGTLDPLAEGVLPIAIGKTTKLISLINNTVKGYEFEIKWGEQTDTDDREGKIIAVSPHIPTTNYIKEKIKSFVGDILQKPPKASAIKINGKRAYQRFRNKELFETKERFVKIHDLKFVDQIHHNISRFTIECGKGFYIRSFARDLGEDLNTKGHIYSLKRTKVGKFTIENSILLDDLLKIRQTAFGIRGIYPSIAMLDDIPAIEIESEEMLKDISHGKIVQIELKNPTKPLNYSDVRLYLAIKNDIIVSLGELDGTLFKPIKVLV